MPKPAANWRAGRGLDGLDDLLDTLRQMEDAAKADLLEKAVLAGLEPIRSRAAEKAPWGSGKLSEDMAKEIVESRTGFVAGHTGPHRDTFYGVMQEFGWRPTGRSKKGGSIKTKLGKEVGGSWQAVSKVPPKPFLRPTVNEQKEAAFQHFRLVLMRWFDSIR